MKKIILLILISFWAKAQTPHFTVTLGWIKIDSSRYNSVWSETVYVNAFTGKVTITGDTITALNIIGKWLVLKDSMIADRQRKIDKLNNMVDISVEYTNNLPDLFKDDARNCKWSKYMKALKKLGYTERYGKPRPICTK